MKFEHVTKIGQISANFERYRLVKVSSSGLNGEVYLLPLSDLKEAVHLKPQHQNYFRALLQSLQSIEYRTINRRTAK